MNYAWWILGGLLYGIVCIFALALCKAAAMADRDWERTYRNHCRGERRV